MGDGLTRLSSLSGLLVTPDFYPLESGPMAIHRPSVDSPERDVCAFPAACAKVMQENSRVSPVKGECPMTVPRDKPYTWVTWLSKLLVGENSCIWAAWFKTHHFKYEKARSDFNFVEWNTRHTALVGELADRLEAEGCEVFIENQNSFKQTSSQSGSVLSGRPDLVAVHPDGRATVYDVKTGRERGSDEAQVKLYMYLLPRAKDTRWHGVIFDGCVVYGDGQERRISATAVDDEFVAAVQSLMRRVVSDTPARRVPSAPECAWCDLTTADCDARIDEAVA